MTSCSWNQSLSIFRRPRRSITVRHTTRHWLVMAAPASVWLVATLPWVTSKKTKMQRRWKGRANDSKSESFWQTVNSRYLPDTFFTWTWIFLPCFLTFPILHNRERPLLWWTWLRRIQLTQSWTFSCSFMYYSYYIFHRIALSTSQPLPLGISDRQRMLKDLYSDLAFNSFVLPSPQLLFAPMRTFLCVCVWSASTHCIQAPPCWHMTHRHNIYTWRYLCKLYLYIVSYQRLYHIIYYIYIV